MTRRQSVDSVSVGWVDMDALSPGPRRELLCREHQGGRVIWVSFPVTWSDDVVRACGYEPVDQPTSDIARSG